MLWHCQARPRHYCHSQPSLAVTHPAAPRYGAPFHQPMAALDTVTDQTIGSAIRQRREAHGFSRQRLADLGKVSTNFVYMVERDDHHNTRHLEQMANVLGLSLLATFAATAQPCQPPSCDYAAQRFADDCFCLAYRALPPRQRRQLQRMLQHMLAQR